MDELRLVGAERRNATIRGKSAEHSIKKAAARAQLPDIIATALKSGNFSVGELSKAVRLLAQAVEVTL